MDALPVGRPQLSPARRFEEQSDIRAEKRERLRGRNNVTSCRSPTRELDTREIKNKLKEKRHQEFLRRRSVSPRPGGTKFSSTKSTSTESTGIGSTSTKSTRIESTSTECSGIESTSIGSTGNGSTGIESTEIESTRIESTSIGSTGIGFTSTKSTRIESSSTESSGIESTSIGSTGIGSTSTKSTRIKSTSTESSGIESTSTESSGIESTSIGSSGIESTSIGSAGIGSTSTESTSTKSTSIESTGSSSRSSPHTMRHHTSSSHSEALQTSTPKKQAANGHPKMIVMPTSSGAEEDPNASKQDSSRSERTQETIPVGPHENTPASTSAARGPDRQRVKGRPRKQRSEKVNIQMETVFQDPSAQSQVHIEKKVLENSGMRTEPGFVLVRESDLERLARYLEEALWREDALKQKLAALQKTTSDLLNSSDAVWTSRFSEDVLRRKIKTLEAQLLVCLQKFPAETMEQLVVRTEQQRLLHEEKALDALQRATREKAEAVGRAETLQEAVHGGQAEALRWRRRYEELRLTSDQLRQDQRLTRQRLHSREELLSRRDGLEEEVSSLRQDKRELQHNASVLEEDNRALRGEIQQLRGGGEESRDFSAPEPRLPEKVGSVRGGARLEEQLRRSEEALQLRQRECEELQMELDVMKQECQSSQVRLSQCREELRKLSHSRRTRTRCASGWSVCAAVLLLLAAVATATLCLAHPPFREQAEDVYADVWTRIEGYLREAASPQPGCFRPM